MDMRRTGRTTRMLAKARKLSREGRAVYVVVDAHSFPFVRDRMSDDLNIKVETLAWEHPRDPRAAEAHLVGNRALDFLTRITYMVSEIEP